MIAINRTLLEYYVALVLTKLRITVLVSRLRINTLRTSLEYYIARVLTIFCITVQVLVPRLRIDALSLPVGRLVSKLLDYCIAFD